MKLESDENNKERRAKTNQTEPKANNNNEINAMFNLTKPKQSKPTDDADVWLDL